MAGSPAAAAGIEEGDVIVAIDDDPVTGAASLTAFVRERTADEPVVLTVVRDGETREIDVTLALRDESDVVEPEPDEQPVFPRDGGAESAPDDVPGRPQDMFGN
ncbi:PDZ domain-containing protein [Promicromonospora sp. AC04]|nr:PDZ domain-containing protein [Promicromonospora sp. AC04]